MQFIYRAAKWFSGYFSLGKPKQWVFRIKNSNIHSNDYPQLEDRSIAVNHQLNILYYKPEGQDIKLLSIPEDLAELLRKGFVL